MNHYTLKYFRIVHRSSTIMNINFTVTMIDGCFTQMLSSLSYWSLANRNHIPLHTSCGELKKHHSYWRSIICDTYWWWYQSADKRKNQRSEWLELKNNQIPIGSNWLIQKQSDFDGVNVRSDAVVRGIWLQWPIRFAPSWQHLDSSQSSRAAERIKTGSDWHSWIFHERSWNINEPSSINGPQFTINDG